jgi:ribosomal protein S18 acetylase RimI-like enzyme
MYDDSVDQSRSLSTAGKYLTIVALRELPDIIRYCLRDHDRVKAQLFLYALQDSDGKPHYYYYWQRPRDGQWFVLCDHFLPNGLKTMNGVDAIAYFSREQRRDSLFATAGRFWPSVCDCIFVTERILDPELTADGPCMAVPAYPHQEYRRIYAVLDQFLPGHVAAMLSRGLEHDDLFLTEPDEPLYTVTPCTSREQVKETEVLARRLEPYGPVQFHDPWETIRHNALHGLFVMVPSYADKRETSKASAEPAIGYLASFVAYEKLHIFSLGIEPDFRRSGKASKMIRQVMSFISRPTTFAIANDEYVIEAGCMYKKLGFTYLGRKDLHEYEGTGYGHVFQKDNKAAASGNLHLKAGIHTETPVGMRQLQGDIDQT